MIEKVANYFRDMADSQRISIGLSKGAAAMMARSVDFRNPATWEFSGFSQNGEDGIIDVLLSQVKERNRYFIEIGASDGLENNSAWLSIMGKCPGLMVEGSRRAHARSARVAARYNIGVECAHMFVSKSNVAELRRRAMCWEPDVFSLDIDGIDYYVAKRLFEEGMRPKICVVEYNSVFGPERSVTVEYTENFVASCEHASNLYYGVSLAGWREFFEKHDYQFATVDQNGVNAFFVDKACFEVNFLESIRALEFAENRSQLLRFGCLSAEQFKLIEDQKFFSIS